MENVKQIDVARDFSLEPSGRFRNDSGHSGERFREEFLVPALEEAGSVRVILDGTSGYGSSFLNEAITKVFENGTLQPSDYGHRLVLVADDPDFEFYKKFVEAQIMSVDPKPSDLKEDQ